MRCVTVQPRQSGGKNAWNLSLVPFVSSAPKKKNNLESEEEKTMRHVEHNWSKWFETTKSSIASVRRHLLLLCCCCCCMLFRAQSSHEDDNSQSLSFSLRNIPEKNKNDSSQYNKCVQYECACVTPKNKKTKMIHNILFFSHLSSSTTATKQGNLTIYTFRFDLIQYERKID